MPEDRHARGMQPTGAARPAGERIDVAFGVDDKYLPHAAAVMASVLRRAGDAQFRFIILHDRVPAPRRAALEAAFPGAAFHWAEVRDEDVPPFADREHFSRAILFRLGLEQLAPVDCKRVLYLDADITVLGDVREIWRADLQGAPLGAIVDSYVDAAEFAARWGLSPSPAGYFNSGILLIDLEQVRAQKLFGVAVDFVARQGADTRFTDQDALNFATWGRWKALPPAWNAQLDMVAPWLAPRLPRELQFHDRLPEIVHFTGPEKPWAPNAYHPWAWVYWSCLARTPFLAEVSRAAGVSAFGRFKLWVRWLRRRPRAAA